MLDNYIKMGVIMQIYAFDFQFGINGSKMVVVGETMVLENDQLFHISFVLTAPKSKQEFFINLPSNSKFATPPHGYKVNPLKCQWAYEAYLKFFNSFIDL